MIGFNAYERQARLAPGLLALLPISIGAISLGLEEAPVISAIGGLLTAAGGPLVLVNTVRTRGRDLQRRLYVKWGGAPTTALLRLTADTENATLRDQWRSRLAERAAVDLPSADDERRDLQSCDERYEVMTSWAREHTREAELVQHENRTYGFVRNLAAIRPIGLAVAVAVAVVLVLVALLSRASAAILAGLLVTSAFAAFWVFWPTEARVHEAANRYARQLFISAVAKG